MKRNLNYSNYQKSIILDPQRSCQEISRLMYPTSLISLEVMRNIISSTKKYWNLLQLQSKNPPLASTSLLLSRGIRKKMVRIIIKVHIAIMSILRGIRISIRKVSLLGTCCLNLKEFLRKVSMSRRKGVMLGSFRKKRKRKGNLRMVLSSILWSNQRNKSQKDNF